MQKFAGSAVNLGNFLRALGVYLPYFVYSTFLSLFVPEEAVGLVFTAGSIIAAAVVILSPQLFRKFRTHRVMAVAGCVAAVSLGLLALFPNAATAIGLFIVFWNAGWIVALSLDVILEKIVGGREQETGETRATFLTASNIAVVIVPLFIAAALTDSQYWRVFIVAAGAFFAASYLAVRFFAQFPHVEHTNVNLKDALQSIARRPYLLSVMGAHFVLQFLFVWTGIYLPLYLHNHAHLEWGIIGVILSLAMLPYVLLQIPIGWLADKKWGEKEFIVGGFLLASIGFISFFFGAAAHVITLALAVIVIHTGGAVLEIATESNFFKNVGPGESELVGVFRVLRQFATITGPLIGTALLFVASFEYTFMIFGLFFLVGIPIALSIKDSR